MMFLFTCVVPPAIVWAPPATLDPEPPVTPPVNEAGDADVTPLPKKPELIVMVVEPTTIWFAAVVVAPVPTAIELCVAMVWSPIASASSADANEPLPSADDLSPDAEAALPSATASEADAVARRPTAVD